MMDLTKREQEVVECWITAWLKDDMRLYGGLCYQDTIDLLDKLGIDCHYKGEVRRRLEEIKEQFIF